MLLIIDRLGRALCLYDEMLDLNALGQPSIRRASHVEADVLGRWWADLLPVGGPRLGPHQRRSQAVAAERDWLNHWLLNEEDPHAIERR